MTISFISQTAYSNLTWIDWILLLIGTVLCIVTEKKTVNGKSIDCLSRPVTYVIYTAILTIGHWLLCKNRYLPTYAMWQPSGPNQFFFPLRHIWAEIFLPFTAWVLTIVWMEKVFGFLSNKFISLLVSHKNVNRVDILVLRGLCFFFYRIRNHAFISYYSLRSNYTKNFTELFDGLKLFHIQLNMSMDIILQMGCLKKIRCRTWLINNYKKNIVTWSIC